MTTSNYNRSRFVPGGDGAVMRNVENSAIEILQESQMLSNNSRAAETRPGNRHDALSGRDIPIEDIDGVVAGNRRLAPVPRPDSSARRISSGIWTNWRRERAIKRAVYALAEFDDRTLREMGIPQRSQIERTVRHGRDC